jgi:hypothetical protein
MTQQWVQPAVALAMGLEAARGGAIVRAVTVAVAGALLIIVMLLLVLGIGFEPASALGVRMTPAAIPFP